MKTIFVLLAFALSLSSIAQNNLDTVYIRTLTMQAQDWAWLTGSYPKRADSLTLKGFRKIRSTVQSNIPASFTTNITVDSVPGKVIVLFYHIVKTTPAGEIAARYQAITSAISAKTVLAYWIGVIDGTGSAEYTRHRDIGKNDLIDQ